MAKAILQSCRKVPPVTPQLTLQEFQQATGWIYSYEDIAAMTGLSVRTVTRIANPQRLRESHKVTFGLLWHNLERQEAA
jgi:hypothetical protein